MLEPQAAPLVQLVNKAPANLTGEDFRPSQLGTGNDAYTLTRKLYQHVDANGYYASYPNCTLPAQRSVIIYLPVQQGYATGGYVVHPVVFNAISNDVTLVSASYWNVTDGGAIEAVIRGNGVVLDAGTNWVACVMQNDSQIVVNSANPPTNKYYYGTLALYVDLPDTGLHTLIDNQTEELGEQTQRQTEELKNTSGSGGVIDGVMGNAQQIVQGADFVQQSASFVSAAFATFATAEPSDTLRFPGLSVMGFVVPASDVPLGGYLSDDVMELMRSALTMFVFLAWVNGLVGMYHKIFLGEQVVEVAEE